MSKGIRLIVNPGARFNRLVILKEVESFKYKSYTFRQFLCQCDCGNQTTVKLNALSAGTTKSCGCYKKELDSAKGRANAEIIENGTRFGKLTIVSEIVRKNTTTARKFNCICDCGKETQPYLVNLKQGKSTSCGCASRGAYKSESAYKLRLRGIKNKAKERGFIFSLSDEEALKLISGACHYCGEFNRSPSKKHSGVKLSGIDRMDSNLGYIAGNVVSCCPKCNKAKGTMSYIEFLNQIKLIFQNLKENIIK